MAILQHTWQCSCDSVSTFHFGPLVRHPPRSHQGVKSHCRRGLHHLVALHWSVHLQEHLCWHHGLVHMCGLDFLSLTKLCAFIMEMNTKWHEISVLLSLIIILDMFFLQKKKKHKEKAKTNKPFCCTYYYYYYISSLVRHVFSTNNVIQFL